MIFLCVQYVQFLRTRVVIDFIIIFFFEAWKQTLENGGIGSSMIVVVDGQLVTSISNHERKVIEVGKWIPSCTIPWEVPGNTLSMVGLRKHDDHEKTQ